jgi:hypothetical protein
MRALAAVTDGLGVINSSVQAIRTGCEIKARFGSAGDSFFEQMQGAAVRLGSSSRGEPAGMYLPEGDLGGIEVVESREAGDWCLD